MRFFLDAGVPDSAASVLVVLGHEAILHRHRLAEGAPDDLVSRTAIVEKAILVAHDRDMRRIVKPYGSISRAGTNGALNLVNLLCAEWQAAARLEQAISLVEHEWHVCERKRARRLWVDIGAHFLRTHR